MYDCQNDTIYVVRWDDNKNCEGAPTTNLTDGVCTDSSLCNCVPAEQSNCTYIEYIVYPSSSCSGTYSTRSQVLDECYRSYDGTGSFKLDCEPDTLLETSYSNTECNGGGNTQEYTFFTETPCVKVTCKSDGYIRDIVSIVIIMSILVTFF